MVSDLSAAAPRRRSCRHLMLVWRGAGPSLRPVWAPRLQCCCSRWLWLASKARRDRLRVGVDYWDTSDAKSSTSMALYALYSHGSAVSPDASALHTASSFTLAFCVAARQRDALSHSRTARVSKSHHLLSSLRQYRSAAGLWTKRAIVASRSAAASWTASPVREEATRAATSPTKTPRTRWNVEHWPKRASRAPQGRNGEPPRRRNELLATGPVWRDVESSPRTLHLLKH